MRRPRSRAMPRIAFADPGRTEHRHARADEVQRAEAHDELVDRAQDEPQFAGSRVRAFEQHAVVPGRRRRRLRLAGLVRGRCLEGH